MAEMQTALCKRQKYPPIKSPNHVRDRGSTPCQAGFLSWGPFQNGLLELWSEMGSSSPGLRNSPALQASAPPRAAVRVEWKPFGGGGEADMKEILETRSASVTFTLRFLGRCFALPRRVWMPTPR